MKKIDLMHSHFVRALIKWCIMIKMIGVIVLATVLQVSAGTNLTYSQSVKGSEITKEGFSTEPTQQQPQKKTIRGKVTDVKGVPMPGATVAVKGTTIGTITDTEGNYSLAVPAGAKSLLISFIGLESQELQIGSQSIFNVQLKEATVAMSDVVVVGYGVQKRESVIAAITNTTNKDLKTRGGVANLASAMSAQLPGVSIMERTGEPGKEDPAIFIRGQSTWNGTNPLILVDGIERRMNDINVNEVENISVLKDASATAVFGVRGANGVILITTKRGEIGKANLTVSAGNTFKAVSKVTGLMESYSARSYKNAGIEHELPVSESSWSYYTPYETLQRFKLPQSPQYKYLYPNINWQDDMIKPFATEQNFAINVRGGTKDTKYFASVAYLHQGDILKSGKSDHGYDPKFAYDRINFRGNLDFQLTPTTTLSTDLNGYASLKRNTAIYSNNWLYRSIYYQAPDAFIDQYPDGMYGKNPYDINGNVWNTVASLNNSGITRTNNLFIGTNAKLVQKLDFITKGLSLTGKIAFDNTFSSSGPNIQDGSNQGQVIYKYIDPSILTAKNKADSTAAVVYIPSYGSTATTTGYDLILRPWTVANETVTTGSTRRTLYYEASLNWARSFYKHDLTALAVFSRYRDATGGMFASFREDWVSRVTYNYDGKYFAEANGAYNGSEKFGPGYRFGFFPSLSAGWLVSKESFLQYDWLSKLKLRASIGKIGSDNGIPRWGYIPSWTTGGNAFFGNAAGTISPITAIASPYTTYSEGTIANPVINWETALKKNIGLELSILNNKFTAEFDYFKDDRSNIFMASTKRNIPVYFGAAAVPINLGKTTTKGYELDITYRNKFSNGLGYYIRYYMTRSKDIVTKAEDPLLQPAYLKTVGFPIGQTRAQQRTTTAKSWNDVYAQTAISTPLYKLPGDYDVKDFNGDGLIDGFDSMNYAYTDNAPMNTYSTTLGLDFKGFNFMIQFYGITNITRNYFLPQPEAAFRTTVSVLYADYWTPQNTDAAFRAPRLLTAGNVNYADYSMFDGSFLRLKTIELGYQVPEKLSKHLGLSSLRFYINGNNLAFWSKMPDDVEYGYASQSNDNIYPAMKQVNIGVDITF